MQRRLLVNHEEKTITVTPRPEGEGRIAFFEERPYPFQCHSIGPNEFLLDLEGRLIPFYLARDGSKIHISIQGETFLVEEPTSEGGKRKARSDDLSRLVTPPMPATVIRILVGEGSRVRKGETLLVLSAMKMETSLTAPYDGLVKKVNAAVGSQVMPGEILVEIEPQEGGANGA